MPTFVQLVRREVHLHKGCAVIVYVLVQYHQLVFDQVALLHIHKDGLDSFTAN